MVTDMFKSIMDQYMNETISFAEKNQLVMDNYNNFLPRVECLTCQKISTAICFMLSSEIVMYLSEIPDKSDNNIRATIAKYCSLRNSPQYMNDTFYQIYTGIHNASTQQLYNTVNIMDEIINPEENL